MGNAAAKLDITIQYCMPLPNHLMQSVAIPTVTQSRATDDYNPSNAQWKMFHSAQLIWGLGMVPFKDDFWTTSNQPGCKYSLCVEYSPVLETLVAALSAGPVGPSDQIGKMNKELVMRTCRASGDLLKADLPARVLDSTFLPQSSGASPALIQVAASYTAWGPHKWHYLVGANLNTPYTVTTTDLPSGGAAKVFNYFQVNASSGVSDFDASHPIKIPAAQMVQGPGTAAGPVAFDYYVVAPVLESGWVLLGELSKFITVSKQRITDVTSNASELVLTIIGTPGETVTLSLINTAATPQKMQQVSVVISSSSRNVVTCAAGATSMCK